MLTSARTMKNAVDARQSEQRSLPETPSDQCLTDPNPAVGNPDTKHAVDASGPAQSTTVWSPPPSKLPLPLPKGAGYPTRNPGVPTKVTSSSPRKSTEQTRVASSMNVDVAHKSDKVLQPSTSRPKPVGGDRRPAPQPHGEGTREEMEERHVPILPSAQIGHRDTPPPPPPKSGLLKRFKTRLVATTSSPSLRPHQASSEGQSKGKATLDTHQQQEGEEPGGNVTPVPARRPPPVPEEKPKQRPNGRLSLAAIAEKRAERREAREKEEQRATQARRAAALAKTGLLPASRRYSVADVHGFGYEHGQSPPYDPFAKDGIMQERRSIDGVVVDEPKLVGAQESAVECEVSAAEAVIREWREKNTRKNEPSPSTDPSQSQEASDCESQSRDGGSASNDASQSQDAPEEHSPSQERDANDEQLGSGGEENSSTSRSDQASSGSPQSTPEPPQDCQAPSLTEDAPANGTTPSSAPEDVAEIVDVSTSHASSSAEGDTKPSEVLQADEREIRPDPEQKDLKTKSGTDEKFSLNVWRFPSAAASTSTSDSSGTATPLMTKESNNAQPSSPTSPNSTSSASTAVASQSKPLPVLSADVPPPPPPKKQAPEGKEGKKGANVSSQAQASPSTSPPSQTAHSALPTFPAPPSRPRQRSSTATPVPSQRPRLQKHTNGPITSSSALAVSLPALSPTTSTGTSTSGGSALPRTPSTSSHGHSPVRVLDTPMENEEDALLHNEPEELAIIPESKSTVKMTGVREFGQLANLAEESGIGALPPLPSNLASDASTGSGTAPNAEERTRVEDKRSRITLFGRRRAAQNGLPAIIIPEGNAGLSSGARASGANEEGLGLGKPRHISSFTNLRRTVTSVTAGLAGAAGSAIRSRSRSPLRGATLPTTRSAAPPRSDALSSNLLSPASAEMLSPNSRSTGIGLRAPALNPTMHSRGSILMEMNAIEDDESRRLAELAFLQ